MSKYSYKMREPDIRDMQSVELDEIEEKRDTIITLRKEIEQLKKTDEENKEKIKMLYDVADKGRVFNYENKTLNKKPIIIKLALYKDGVIIGWKTIKDELIKHPTTGLTIGEIQEYEVLTLNKNNQIEKFIINGYPAFSNVRYDNRIECEIIGRKEDDKGNIIFDVKYDGKVIQLDSRFVN